MDIQAELHYKCADSDLQLDVDIMTLDYLIHAAIMAVLRDWNSQQRGHLAVTEWTDSTERALTSVDTCLQIFKHNHSMDLAPITLRFRLNLLRFITLFSRRLMPTPVTLSMSSLKSLRKVHQNRAKKWHRVRPSDPYADPFFTLTHAEDLPLKTHQLQICRTHILNKFSIKGHKDLSRFYGSEASISLMDLLPTFMELSAERAGMDNNITERWMELAGEFMLQSTLEKILYFGGRGRETLEEGFAWGFLPGLEDNDNAMDIDIDSHDGPAEEAWQGERVVNAMFRVDLADEEMLDMGGEETQARAEDGEIAGWNEVRERYLNLLKPAKRGAPVANHLLQTAAEYLVVDFEAKVFQYLQALSQSVESPVLIQLEQGQLAGLSRAETKELKDRVGLGSWDTSKS